jgi:bifunctional ADP-heptose synthase (sugar kinase/adenylyltransferase)
MCQKPQQIIGMLMRLSSFAGCATKAMMLNAPLDAGRAQTFSAGYDTVVKATRDALAASGLTIEDASEADDKTFVIVAKKATSTWSWGELVRVTVQAESEEKTTVRVYTRRKLATNITAKGDWADTVFTNIELQLR